jgi:hypothetical protein
MPLSRGCCGDGATKESTPESDRTGVILAAGEAAAADPAKGLGVTGDMGMILE